MLFRVYVSPLTVIRIEKSRQFFYWFLKRTNEVSRSSANDVERISIHLSAKVYVFRFLKKTDV